MDNTRDIATEYATAAGNKDYERLAQLVHPNATFTGTVRNETHGGAAFVDGFRNLAPVTIRHELRTVIADDDGAAILYDLVTNTEVGSVLCTEFLTFQDGLINSSTLVFDWRRWPEVLQQLQAGGATRLRTRTA